tara:strand:- start:182 stop:388 length:207 start_codon:yes stop_codon:yes gene_type:complete
VDYKTILQTLRQTSKIYGLTMKETGLMLGIPLGRVKNWNQGTVVLTTPEFIAWADLLGYEVTLRRKPT